jgi:hypothetical protein
VVVGWWEGWGWWVVFGDGDDGEGS